MELKLICKLLELVAEDERLPSESLIKLELDPPSEDSPSTLEEFPSDDFASRLEDRFAEEATTEEVPSEEPFGTEEEETVVPEEDFFSSELESLPVKQADNPKTGTKTEARSKEFFIARPFN
jgi:hypothetical protein